MLMCFSLHIPGESGVAEALAMTDDEVELIATPASRILAKQKFSPAIRKRIVSSGDYIGLTIGVGAYLIRISEVLKEVQKLVAQQPGRVAAVPRATQNGAHPDPAAAESIAWLGSQYSAN